MYKKFIITAEYGPVREICEVDAEDNDDAMNMAYEMWLKGSKRYAIFDVIGESTDELKKKYKPYL